MDAQMQHMLIYLPFGLAFIFGLWAMNGTFWRGLRLAIFGYAACVLTAQHAALLVELVHYLPFIPLSRPTLAFLVSGGLPTLLFAGLLLTFWLFWRPGAPKHANPFGRLVSLAVGSVVGWTLGATLLTGFADAGLLESVPHLLQSDYGALLYHTVILVSSAVEPLLP